jgi:protein TonB
MTAVTAEILEPTARRFSRWSGALVGALGLHALIIAAAVLVIRQEDPEDGGLIVMDLPPLAIESTSTEPDNAEDAKDTATAPPPSDADDTEPPPPVPEPEPIEKAEPEPPEPEPEAPVEKAEAPVEPPPEAVEEPPVPEAPSVPEPEVVLPKPVEDPTPVEEPKKEVLEEKKPAKKVAERKPPATVDGKKTGPKSNAKAASAAAAGGGKFSPNAISRPQPPYPSAARASRTEGYVVVRYSVAPSGAVTSVSVVSASPAGVFNGVTVSAVRRWRFRPSATGGSGTTTVRFKLR